MPHGFRFVTAALILAAAISLFGARPAFDSFEVATIKPTPGDWTQGRFIRMQSADQFVARGHTLKTLVEAAYNLPPVAISGGPAWIDTDRLPQRLLRFCVIPECTVDQGAFMSGDAQPGRRRTAVEYSSRAACDWPRSA